MELEPDIQLEAVLSSVSAAIRALDLGANDFLQRSSSSLPREAGSMAGKFESPFRAL